MTTLLAAKLLALPIPLLLSAYNITFSQNVVPHLLPHPPSLTTPIFARIYHRGAYTIAPLAAIAITANLYLAYKSTGFRRELYGTAAGCVGMTLVVTRVVMMGGISRLIEIAGDKELQGEKERKEEVEGLLRAWVGWNYLRASLHLVGGLMGLYAALS